MEKEWLKLEGKDVEDDLQTGQVLAVLPTPPATTPTSSPRLWEDCLPRPPPTPCTTLPFARADAPALCTEEVRSPTEPGAVGRASEGRLPELGVGGGVAGRAERNGRGRAERERLGCVESAGADRSEEGLRTIEERGRKGALGSACGSRWGFRPGWGLSGEAVQVPART